MTAPAPAPIELPTDPTGVKAAVRTLLERLPLHELHLLRLYTIPALMRKKTAQLALAEGLSAESALIGARPTDPADPVQAVNGVMRGLAEIDDDDDEVLEPTAVVEVKPITVTLTPAEGGGYVVTSEALGIVTEDRDAVEALEMAADACAEMQAR